ncbi:MAG: discoidin domain-containing protein, partial [Lachnospiraceae bacterium]|nr:discoidin domain-containing protein [Lachnospiraceae bacterium]
GGAWATLDNTGAAENTGVAAEAPAASDAASASASDGEVTAAVAETQAEAVTITVTDSSDTPAGSKISITSAEASSVIDQDGYSNTAYEAYDGDLTTSWQEGVDGAGEGSWLKYTFDGTHQVSSIVFYLGVWREAEGKDYYNDNYRPRQIEISMGGQTWTAEFTDQRIAHIVTFSSPVEASEVTFTILSVYDSNHYADTGIADIMVME